MFDSVSSLSASTEFVGALAPTPIEHVPLRTPPVAFVGDAATSVPVEPPVRGITATVSPEELIAAIKKLAPETRLRLRMLSVAHLEDEEQTRLSNRSLLAFLRFLVAYPDLQEGGVVLTPDGNIRAVWMGSGGERIGLEFLPNQRVKYVALKKRIGDEFSITSGSDFIARAIKALGGFGALEDIAA